MGFDIKVFERHRIAQIPVEPVRLLDQQHPARPVALEPRHHFREMHPSGCLGSLDIFEGLYDLETVAVGVFTQKLGLRSERKTFLLLFTAGNAGVRRRLESWCLRLDFENSKGLAGWHHRTAHGPFEAGLKILAVDAGISSRRRQE